jgi:hypothetical protein
MSSQFTPRKEVAKRAAEDCYQRLNLAARCLSDEFRDSLSLAARENFVSGDQVAHAFQELQTQLNALESNAEYEAAVAFADCYASLGGVVAEGLEATTGARDLPEKPPAAPYSRIGNDVLQWGREARNRTTHALTTTDERCKLHPPSRR